MQKDVLTEILNINMGSAAKVLSELTNQKVILKIPSLDLQSGNEIGFKLFDKSSDFRSSVLSTVRFGKNFSGKAYIIIPFEDAKELVNACTGSYDNEKEIFSEDIDVIKEISNVILNSLIGEFGNLLNVKLSFSFPNVEFAEISAFENSVLPLDMHFLTMCTSFLLLKSKVKGMIFIALSTSSQNMLISKINEMLAAINE